MGWLPGAVQEVEGHMGKPLPGEGEGPGPVSEAVDWLIERPDLVHSGWLAGAWMVGHC